VVQPTRDCFFAATRKVPFLPSWTSGSRPLASATLFDLALCLGRHHLVYSLGGERPQFGTHLNLVVRTKATWNRRLFRSVFFGYNTEAIYFAPTGTSLHPLNENTFFPNREKLGQTEFVFFTPATLAMQIRLTKLSECFASHI
jgi:hypothetical protein